AIWESSARLHLRACSERKDSLQCRGYALVEDCPAIARTRFRCCAGTGLSFIQYPAVGMDRSGDIDRCGGGRAPAILVSVGIVAGRGLLRDEFAVVLHRDAAVRSAS